MTKKIKVEPLTCTKGASVQSIGKSITDIMSFMFSVVEDTNKTILSINKAIDAIPEDYNHKLDEAAKSIVSGIKIPAPDKYDDTAIKKTMAKIEAKIPAAYDDSKLMTEIKSVKSDISNAYDETNVIKKIVGIEGKIPVKFDDTNLVNALKDITQSIQSLSSDMESIKKSVSLNQAEIRSYRNITGGQLDEMRRKLDKLTEMK